MLHAPLDRWLICSLLHALQNEHLRPRKWILLRKKMIFKPSNSVADWGVAGSECKPRPWIQIIPLSKEELLPLIKWNMPKVTKLHWVAGWYPWGMVPYPGFNLYILPLDLIFFRSSTDLIVYVRERLCCSAHANTFMCHLIGVESSIFLPLQHNMASYLSARKYIMMCIFSLFIQKLKGLHPLRLVICMCMQRKQSSTHLDGMLVFEIITVSNSTVIDPARVIWLA